MQSAESGTPGKARPVSAVGTAEVILRCRQAEHGAHTDACLLAPILTTKGRDVRDIVSHKVNGLNEALFIDVLDEPGQGNACHDYVIFVPNDACNRELNASVVCNIHFQNGPIQEAGINGISNEALLAVVEDRLSGFQSGEYACRENAVALTKIQEAMMWLQKRTRDRTARGVEGTSQV